MDQNKDEVIRPQTSHHHHHHHHHQHRNLYRQDIEGCLLIRPKTFKKAKSAATFTLDGISYTIVAGPPDEEDQTNKALPRTGSLTIVKKTLSSSSQQNLTDTSNFSPSKEKLRFKDSFEAMGSSIGEQTLESDELRRMCSLDLSYKLKKLVRSLRIDDRKIPVEDIINNLEEASNILDSFNNGCIRHTMLTDDDEFSRVDTDAVPPEVKDWLSMTFTQSLTSANVKKSSKAKFRSVANCIRAGIVVDRIYRRMIEPTTYQVPPIILTYFKTLDEWSFDILSFNEATEDHSLKMVTLEILQRYDLINKFKMSSQTLDNFLTRVESGYGKHNNTYHNHVHAADVTQTVHSIINSSGLSSWMTDLELLSTIVSSAIHDFEHTGTTNNFHINTKSEYAMLYNDRSVLENHHLSAAFKLMKDSEFNPFSALKEDDYKTFRNLVIEIVLATDMSIHFQQLKNMKSSLSSPNEDIDKAKALALIVHCADISHAAKDWSLHHKWTEMLIEEFFRQGDRESQLGLVISPLCDRKTTHVADSQIGFIGFIVDPSFQVMGDMIDHMIFNFTKTSNEEEAAKMIDKINRPWEKCMACNKQKWKERFNNGWVCKLQSPSVNEQGKKDPPEQ